MPHQTPLSDQYRSDLVHKINERLDELQPMWPNFPMKEARKEVAKYSTEFLEHVVRIFACSNDLISIQLVNRMCIPFGRELLLPAAKLHQQVTALHSYTGRELGFNGMMELLESLACYKDERVPPCPEPDDPIGPVHVALYVIMNTAYALRDDHEFNPNREKIILWIRPGIHRLIDEALLEQITSKPDSAERVSRLALSLSTLHMSELEPFLSIIETYPAEEDRVVELLTQGARNPAQIEAILMGSAAPAISNGIL